MQSNFALGIAGHLFFFLLSSFPDSNRAAGRNSRPDQDSLYKLKCLMGGEPKDLKKRRLLPNGRAELAKITFWVVLETLPVRLGRKPVDLVHVFELPRASVHATIHKSSHTK